MPGVTDAREVKENRVGMSWDFVESCRSYLDVAARSTPQRLRRLTVEMRDVCMQRLPLDTVFDPLRSPLQHTEGPEDLFTIPDDNVFFADLLHGAVLSAEELRERYHGHLVTDPTTHRCVVWMLTEACSHACRALLHFERGTETLVLRALFVAQPDLTSEDRLHETLLFSLATFADVRRLDVHVPGLPDPAAPLTSLLLSLLGFLRETADADAGGGGGPGPLVRLPVEDMVLGGEVLGAVLRQVDRLMRRQCRALVAGRTADGCRSTAAASPPPAPSRSGAAPPGPGARRAAPRR